MSKPKLRFPEFIDEWEQRKLGDLYVERNEKGNDSLQMLSVSIHTGVSNEELDQKSLGKLVRRSKDKSTYKHVYTGDLILNMMRAWQGAIGVAKNEGMVSPAYISAIPNEEVFPLFMDYALRRKETIEQIDSLSYGVTDFRKRLYWDSFVNVRCCLPSTNEQQIIWEFFAQLDILITLHQSKVDKIKEYKRGCLQKLFPREGKTVPEVRFPGFTDAWEQCKLLDCIQKITDFRGRTPKKLGLNWSEEGYLALSALNVKDGYIDFNQDVHYGNQELYDKWMTGNELHKGQVLFTTEAPMGNVAQVPDNRRYILSQRTIAFDVKESLLTENFLATVLRTPTVFSDLTALSSGGTAKGVSQKSLASVEIRLPKDLKEQERIADMFSNIDNLITLHQLECDKLKELKKGLLQQMFV